MTYSYTINLSDAETPIQAGKQLVLAEAPAPAASLQLFRNGLLMSSTGDYQLTGHVVLLTEMPAAGDQFTAYYRFV